MKRILPLAIIILLLFSCNTSIKENGNQKLTKKELIENFTELVESDVKDDNIDGSFSIAIIYKVRLNLFIYF